jgi:hypothetical protein
MQKGFCLKEAFLIPAKLHRKPNSVLLFQEGQSFIYAAHPKTVPFGN